MNKEVSLDIEQQSIIVRTLVKVQIVEFLIHALVSHFKPEILNKTALAGLTAKVFLSPRKEGKKERKPTTPTGSGCDSQRGTICVWKELGDYLANRNDFVHHFWRNYISKSFDRDKCIGFLMTLEMQTEEWTRVFRGLLSVIAKRDYVKAFE